MQKPIGFSHIIYDQKKKKKLNNIDLRMII